VIELEIFSFISRGVSVSELASELNVSVKTIETHQMRMKDKLGVHTAAELRQKAREWLAKSAVNRIREDRNPNKQTECAFALGFERAAVDARGYRCDCEISVKACRRIEA
jgi:DNA-binding CsgD family transcriptional regulator